MKSLSYIKIGGKIVSYLGTFAVEIYEQRPMK